MTASQPRARTRSRPSTPGLESPGSTASTVSVRAATEEDAGPIAALAARAFIAAYGAQVAPDVLEPYVQDAFTPERQALELGEPDAAFLIAEADGAAIGFAHLVEGTDTPAAGAHRPVELARLFVVPRWNDRGVDGALLQAALEEAARRGCDAIWLGVWTENRGTIDFYERSGFREVGRQPFTIGGNVIHDLLMRRAVFSPTDDGEAGGRMAGRGPGPARPMELDR